MHHKEIVESIDKLQSALAAFKCTRMKDGQCCTSQHEDERDITGRPVFYYATGCKVVEGFCPACRAYWHVAVARNAIFDWERQP